MIYLDASALITLVTERPPVAELHAFLEERVAPMATSTLGFIETIRTMDRIGDYPDLMHRLLRAYTEIAIEDDIRDAAAHLTPKLRTLDAVHVASAQSLGDALLALVTYDKKMLDVARGLGLPVAAPGLEA